MPRQQAAVQSDFISYLLTKEHLKEIHTPVKNCLVLYFDQISYFNEDTKTYELKLIPRHAGILKRYGKTDFSKIVRSRWGDHKALLEHRLWYVGINYGTLVRYYQPLSPQQSEGYFREFEFPEETMKVSAEAVF